MIGLTAIVCLLFSLIFIYIPASLRSQAAIIDSHSGFPLMEQRPANSYHNEFYGISERYICETSKSSPLAEDVRAAITGLAVYKGRRWCEQVNRFVSRCTRMTDHGSASIAICGEFLSRIKCLEASESVAHLGLACSMNIDGEVRLGGKVAFEWGYISVYHT